MLGRTAHVFEEKWRSKDVILQEEADFSSLLLSDRVLFGLEKAGFVKPSPIQLESIPVGRYGKDIVVQAKSGTGKTLVFTIVALEMLLDAGHPQVLILAPTREVASQICEVIKSVGSTFKNLKCCSFIGGLPVIDDKENARGCQIFVGTPGRVKQLINMGILRTNSIRLFVLDEADQLLEPSFKCDVDWIFLSLPKDKQVIAASATFPKELKKFVNQYFRDPYIARLNMKELSLLGIVHYVNPVQCSKLPFLAYKLKLRALENMLDCIKFSQCLVFCNLVSRVETLCADIKKWGFSTTYITGAKEQIDRLKAIECLKHFKCKVLVSSDVTSRGIDAENVDLVINFDSPLQTETYLHRVGRAGRYGSRGVAITLLTENDLHSFGRMENEGNFKSYHLPDPVPSDLISLIPEDNEKTFLSEMDFSNGDKNVVIEQCILQKPDEMLTSESLVEPVYDEGVLRSEELLNSSVTSSITEETKVTTKHDSSISRNLSNENNVDICTQKDIDDQIIKTNECCESVLTNAKSEQNTYEFISPNSNPDSVLELTKECKPLQNQKKIRNDEEKLTSQVSKASDLKDSVAPLIETIFCSEPILSNAKSEPQINEFPSPYSNVEGALKLSEECKTLKTSENVKPVEGNLKSLASKASEIHSVTEMVETVFCHESVLCETKSEPKANEFVSPLSSPKATLKLSEEYKPLQNSGNCKPCEEKLKKSLSEVSELQNLPGKKIVRKRKSNKNKYLKPIKNVRSEDEDLTFEEQLINYKNFRNSLITHEKNTSLTESVTSNQFSENDLVEKSSKAVFDENHVQKEPLSEENSIKLDPNVKSTVPDSLKPEVDLEFLTKDSIQNKDIIPRKNIKSASVTENIKDIVLIDNNVISLNKNCSKEMLEIISDHSIKESNNEENSVPVNKIQNCDQNLESCIKTSSSDSLSQVSSTVLKFINIYEQSTDSEGVTDIKFASSVSDSVSSIECTNCKLDYKTDGSPSCSCKKQENPITAEGVLKLMSQVNNYYYKVFKAYEGELCKESTDVSDVKLQELQLDNAESNFDKHNNNLITEMPINVSEISRNNFVKSESGNIIPNHVIENPVINSASSSSYEDFSITNAKKHSLDSNSSNSDLESKSDTKDCVSSANGVECTLKNEITYSSIKAIDIDICLDQLSTSSGTPSTGAVNKMLESVSSELNNVCERKVKCPKAIKASIKRVEKDGANYHSKHLPRKLTKSRLNGNPKLVENSTREDLSVTKVGKYYVDSSDSDSEAVLNLESTPAMKNSDVFVNRGHPISSNQITNSFIRVDDTDMTEDQLSSSSETTSSSAKNKVPKLLPNKVRGRKMKSSRAKSSVKGVHEDRICCHSGQLPLKFSDSNLNTNNMHVLNSSVQNSKTISPYRMRRTSNRNIEQNRYSTGYKSSLPQTGCYGNKYEIDHISRSHHFSREVAQCSNISHCLKPCEHRCHPQASPHTKYCQSSLCFKWHEMFMRQLWHLQKLSNSQLFDPRHQSFI